jgi:hypothetical protein
MQRKGANFDRGRRQQRRKSIGQTVAEQERKQTLRKRATRCRRTGQTKAETAEEDVNEMLRRKEPDVESNQMRRTGC